MSLTKVEAAKLTNDVFQRGVIQTVIKESMLLQLLPFDEIIGTAKVYNREATMPAASFYDPLDTWTEATPTFTQVTAALKIIGGDAQVDNFLQQSYANPNDLEAVVIASRAKAVGQKYCDTFWNGDTAVDAKSFDGMTKTLTGTAQELFYGANGAQLTLDQIDEMIDLVIPGRPDMLACSRRTRRKLSSLRRASGNLLETSTDAFGRRVDMYDGIPLVVDDYISNAQTKGASGAVCTSLYGIKFGDQEGVIGLENSGGINVVQVGDLETADATKWRIKWYAAIQVAALTGIARIGGILP